MTMSEKTKAKLPTDERLMQLFTRAGRCVSAEGAIKAMRAACVETVALQEPRPKEPSCETCGEVGISKAESPCSGCAKAYPLKWTAAEPDMRGVDPETGRVPGEAEDTVSREEPLTINKNTPADPLIIVGDDGPLVTVHAGTPVELEKAVQRAYEEWDKSQEPEPAPAKVWPEGPFTMLPGHFKDVRRFVGSPSGHVCAAEDERIAQAIGIALFEYPKCVALLDRATGHFANTAMGTDWSEARDSLLAAWDASGFTLEEKGAE
jgi:hypothetical protein